MYVTYTAIILESFLTLVLKNSSALYAEKELLIKNQKPVILLLNFFINSFFLRIN